ncbi:MAG TPA: HAD-IC family P-type ATPase [Stellaceae bacterium]|nr:HAD-IC family P-type ATPase [Stellaceae bacterium]
MAVRGRARFRIPALRRQPGLKHALEAGLGGNGIRSVSASTTTGTVLVLFEPSHALSEIEERVRQLAARGPEARPPAIFSEAPRWHSLDASQVLASLGAGQDGLSTAVAAAQLRRHGRNALWRIERRTGLGCLLGQFRNLPNALLAGTAVLSLMTGGAFDAAIVFAVIVVNAMIGFVSESWTEQTIASLERGALPAAHVLRDGVETTVAAEDLVPGDVIVVHGNDAVPADARVIAADRLTVNEATLTGESLPVAKAPNVLAAANAPLAERRNMLYRGSVVTGGSGRAVVVATGDRTEIARVQALLGSAARPETPLQVQLDNLGRRLAFGAAGAAGLMFAIGLLRGLPALMLLRSAVSLGVAAVPEGLPTMVTASLAMGVRRLRSQDLLVRRLEAIEGLGAVRLVCFDKTGTLTLNRMTVTRLRWNGHEARLDNDAYRDGSGAAVALADEPDLRRLLEICVLCNDAEPGSTGGSSTEAALLEAADRLGLEVTPLRDAAPRLSAVERAAGRRYMATVHASADGGRLIAVKGDPEEVLALCRYRSEAGEIHDLAEGRAKIEADNLAMAEAGLRVLGIAFRQLGPGAEVGAPAENLVWLGLVGMADPIRRGAAELIAAFRRAGIATVMLTGDQRATALAIAGEVGLTNGDAEVVEGDALDEASIGSASPAIFARLTPAQKLQVVAALQRSGRRVAMIGDGVNDTPALKVADVGITLATSATDVARDIADIVLLGDDLRPLALAFEEGRAVHANLRRAVRFLIATNLSEILLMLFAVATGLTRPLTTAQLLWINLLTDVLPAVGLSLAPADPELLSQAAAEPEAPVVSRSDLPLLARDAGLLAGSALAAQVLSGMRRGPATGGSVGFASLGIGQLLYTLACVPKSQPAGGTMVAALGASAAAQAAALLLPALRGIVGIRLGAADLSVSVIAGLVPLGLVRTLDADRAITPERGLRPPRR